MKKYEKPMLAAFSLSGSEALCTGCEAMKLKETTTGGLAVDLIDRGLVPDSDGITGPSKDDFMSYFGNTEDCDKPIPEYEFYCKHTGAMTIIWS